MAREKLSQEALVAEYRNFLEPFTTVVLATVSAGGAPEASVAPFVWAQRPKLYVYLSDLARHAVNLRETGRVSLLFVEDQRGGGANAFARRRLSFQCLSERVERDTREWGEILDLFAKDFGKVAQLIRPLKDFNLYCLSPLTGSYVRGFADAYRIDGEALDRMSYRDGRDGEGTNETSSPHFSPDARVLACSLSSQRILLSRQYGEYSAPSENPL